ncbi:MAG: zinc-ribbon domain-containing protein [bacterium]
MTNCPKCGEKIEEGSVFCQNCGASIEKKDVIETKRMEGLMGKVEQSIYFKIARGFAWLILFVAVIGLVISIVYVTPSITDLIGGETGVSQDEIRNAIVAEKSWRQFSLEESQETILTRQLNDAIMRHT